ncbi:ketoacyl-ACP synthase III [bacterium]|nr:ketoacyl-ACP synthase III [bacterium]
MKAGILGTGFYVPDKILTNADIEKMVDTSDEWITTRTGIKERHIIDDKQTTSDLAVFASQNALKNAKVDVSEVDCIIFATITPDMPFPSTACILQDKIGAKTVCAFDVNAACCGFIYALTMAKSFVENDTFKKVLVVAADALSRITDWTDRTTCVLFGDGAGAVVVGRAIDNKRVILGSYLGADGSAWDLLNMPAGGAQSPATHKTIDERLHFLKMNGNSVFKLAVRAMTNAAETVLAKCNLKNKDVDLVIPHQANLRIINALAQRLNAPLEKVWINVTKYGNVSGASVPIAMAEADASGKLEDGQIVLLDAFGAGLTWASAIIRW